MLLDRREGLAQAFKEESENLNAKKGEVELADLITAPRDPVLVACENLIEAVRLYQAGIKKGYGKKTKDNKFWKAIVAKALGVSRLYPARWEAVCEKVQTMGLEIITQDSGRQYWNYQPLSIEEDISEETEEPIAVVTDNMSAADLRSKAKAEEEGSFIVVSVCSLCGTGGYEVYPDSRGLFRCNACNDLHESESEKIFSKKYEQRCPQ
mgnify:CR=1 FL=1